MSTLFKYLLVAHVVAGILAVAGLWLVWLNIIKDKVNISFVKNVALWTVILLFLSWVSGGWYYVQYYGTAVKPIIKAGSFPLAHSIVMEWKEHIFLLLPFLAISILGVFLFAGDQVESNLAVRRSATRLAGAATILGIIITLAGVVISGAVR